MKFFKFSIISLLSLLLVVTAGVPGQAAVQDVTTYGDSSRLQIEKLASYDSGAEFDEGGTEIVDYNPETGHLYSVNGFDKALDIIDLNDVGAASSLERVKRVGIEDLGEHLSSIDDLTSVAVHPTEGYVAVAVPADPSTEPGHVVFLNAEGKYINDVQVGSLPDMVTFSPDGQYVLIANEGEPSDDYTVDPAGSVSILDVSEGVEDLSSVTSVTFEDVERDEDVRIGNPNADFVNDAEPEYISVSADSEKAYVALQENNAIAVLDLTTQTFERVYGLGFKDHSLEENALDASNDDGEINIANYPLLGMYMPDGIDTFQTNGQTYLLTANEGDAREYDAFVDETEVGEISEEIELNADHYEGYTQEELDALVENGLFDAEQMGNLAVTSTMGKQDTTYEALYSYGARSFSIWNTDDMNRVYDSGDAFESLTAEALPSFFNTTNDEDAFDDRSDNKGPEPEAVITGSVNGETYAFTGLERIGGIMVYNVSDPSNATFETYVTSRDFSGDEPAGDIAPEGMKWIGAEKSPTENPLLVVAHEVSGTIAVYEVKEGNADDVSEPAATDGSETVTVMHFNDSHSRVFEGDYDGMGFAKMATLVDQIRNENPGALLLDAGDTYHGQTFASLVEGESLVRITNELGVDAMAAGNHDFNYGDERLLELAEMAEYPVMAANVQKDDGAPLLDPYVIRETNGLRIGILGLATPETTYKTHPKNVEGLTFTDPAAAAEKWIPELKAENVDAIVAVAHVGMDASSEDTSLDIAQANPEIDLIVDGHSHSTLPSGREVGDTLIVSAGEYTKNLGVVKLTFDEDRQLIGKEAKLMTKEEAADVEEDSEMTSLIESIQQDQESVLNEVIGQTDVVLNGEREDIRTSETNLGNLVADAMLSVTGADFALTNGGGIRATIDQGNITKGDVITVLPFGNFIQTKEVQGSDIKVALENGVSAYPETKGAFPQVAGMTYKIDPDRAVGERVHSVTVQGEALDVERTYVMATNDFLAAGGDEYAMFADLKHLGDFPALDEAVIQHIQEQDIVAPEVQGRIQVAAVPGSEDSQEAAQDESGAEEMQEWEMYTVQPGDTLSEIAQDHGTTWQRLDELNGLDNPDLIYPQQDIQIPTS